MAEASVLAEQFSCPVCLDLLKDPVTIPCGHSFCMRCIADCWDQQDQKRVSCPQCRQTLAPRPTLGKNTMLSEVVEKLKETTLNVECVECDICTGRKHKAVKSCLVCLESYCQTHFERHDEFHSRKRHKVIDATGRLQQMVCHQHDKILEVFCRTDQQFVCLLCAMDEHKNHDTVSTAAERKEKEKNLKETQRKIQQRIQQRQKELQELREVMSSHTRSAQTAVEDSKRIFTELIRFIERSQSDVIQRIRDQEKAAVSQAERQLEQLDQEIEDLKRKVTEMELLSVTDDHVHFLQEVVMDFRKNSVDHPPLTIDSSTMERVSNTKFLGVHITEDLTWSTNTTSLSKKAQQRLHFLRRLKRASLTPPTLTIFYRGAIESTLTSCITVWYGYRKTLQRTVNTAAKIIRAPLPSIQDIFLARCSRKATSIAKDPTHPFHRVFQLLPSGRRYRSIRARSTRLINSFFPQAVRALNSNHLTPTLNLHSLPSTKLL